MTAGKGVRLMACLEERSRGVVDKKVDESNGKKVCEVR